MNPRVIVVFGGTGFLGRSVVRHLHGHGFAVRAASRDVHLSQRLFGADHPRLQPIKADILDEQSVVDAMRGAHGAVNAVSLYTEHGKETFHSVHVDGAQRVAAAARRAGVERFAHVSGIGAAVGSESRYIRSRGEGELAVQAAFPGAIIIRPAVMFGPGDAFLTVVLGLLRRFRAYPMFGRGRTRLQPVYVEDVAEAINVTLQRREREPITFEFGGPRVYSYEELLRSIARQGGLSPLLFPVPFAAWHVMAAAAELLPRPPVARNQVELMRVDNVVSAGMPGFGDLGLSPRPIEEIVWRMAQNR